MGHFWRGGPGGGLRRVRERDPGRRPQTGPRRSPREGRCPTGRWPKVSRSENTNWKFRSKSKTKTTPRTPRESSPIISRSRSCNLKSASGTNDDELLARVRRECDQRKIWSCIIRAFQIDKDRPIAYLQITTDTAAAARTRISHNSKPTSGHLKVKILNRPLDTSKLEF